MATCTSESAGVTLAEADILGAHLEELFNQYTIPELRWWLLCCGIEVSTSLTKQHMAARYRVCVERIVFAHTSWDRAQLLVSHGIHKNGIRSVQGSKIGIIAIEFHNGSDITCNSIYLISFTLI